MKHLFLAALFLVAAFATVAFASSYTPERLVAVGDIHGDLDQAKAILSLANVIDPQTGKWSGGSHTKLVQLGDLVDRGVQDKEVLDFFMGLQKEAAAAGGEVTLMIGNHEVMNLMGDVRYVHPTSMEGFGGRDGHRKAWAKGGEIGDWIRENFKLVHVYNGTLFVHAGLAASYATYGIDKLNAVAKAALNANDFNNPVFGNSGPVWTRLLINKAEYGKCDMVEATLKKLGVERMIVGHTPQRDLRVKAFCNAQLIAIDVGISKNMYGGLAAVEISQGEDGEAILEEIVPNDADERANAELNKLEEQGGADADMLQEMLQAVNEAEGDSNKKKDKKKKNAKKGGEKKLSATERAMMAAKAAREHKEKTKRQKQSEEDGDL